MPKNESGSNHFDTESDISAGVQLSEVEHGNLKRAAVASYILVNAFYLVFSFAEALSEQSRGLYYYFAGHAGMALNTAAIMYMIHKMANRVTRKGTARLFDVWGLTWRTIVVQLFGVVAFAFSLLILGISIASLKSSPSFAFASNLMVLPVSALTIWLLFSNDRKGQVLWLLQAFNRG